MSFIAAVAVIATGVLLGLAQVRGAEGGPRATLVPVVEGLKEALLVTAPPGDERLFVVQKEGLIRVVRDGRLADEPFLDLRESVSKNVEQGLLGLAFHRDYDLNGRFFVDFTDLDGDVQVVEYRVSSDPGRADPASARPILTIPQPSPIHNGGHLAFGPDRMLYIGSGDGGPGADPNRNGQRVDTLLGKLLRIDVDRRQDGLAYGIPPDNPFVGRPGARPEIWAYGLRNPWRFSFDRDTGDIWIGDVGEFLREEIDFLPARAPGVNYGWSVAEGFVPLPNRGEAQGNPPVLPVAAYAHGPGAPRKGGTKAKRCSVTGGYVYRGRDVPELSGMYLFSDWCTGEVFAMPAPPQSNPVPVAGVPPLQWVTSFGEGADAELYIVADGTVYRFAPKG